MTISFSQMVLTQTFIQCVGKFLHQALTLKDEPVFVTNVSSQWKQLYFSDCFHSSRRAEEAAWYLHLPCVGSLLLPLSCFQQPQSTLLFWQENPPNGTNESWNPFLSAVLSRCSIRKFFTDSAL